MPAKYLRIEGVGNVPFYKRKSSKSVRIRISGHDVKVSMPSWMPYKAAELYVTQKADWINNNIKIQAYISDGYTIGKQRKLIIELSPASRFSSKITKDSLKVRIPSNLEIDSNIVQSKLTTLIIKSLQLEAEESIIPRARELAKIHGYDVKKIEVKNLKSRWGSCTSKHDLAFSLFLIQLPWECIDYVIFHEFAHTLYLNHSREFWNEVEKHIPNYKRVKKIMKNYSPHLAVS